MGEHVPTYREIALAQAVISHGTIEVPMSMPHSNYRAPNSPADVVKAAVAYERFLDRSWDEPEKIAAGLAVVLAEALDHVPTADTVDNEGDANDDLATRIGVELAVYRNWRAQLAEPF